MIEKLDLIQQIGVDGNGNTCLNVNGMEKLINKINELIEEINNKEDAKTHS
ncbi:MAG: hypothetical protein H6743_03895 [Rickettsiaceae bacterium]|nr:hypothetical protein [Rickettsiaceae bacterium]